MQKLLRNLSLYNSNAFFRVTTVWVRLSSFSEDKILLFSQISVNLFHVPELFQIFKDIWIRRQAIPFCMSTENQTITQKTSHILTKAAGVTFQNLFSITLIFQVFQCTQTSGYPVLMCTYNYNAW